MAYTTILRGLTVREAVEDAMYRAVTGLDTANQALFDSAFTADAVFDLNGTMMNGLAEIRTQMYDHIAKLDTTHFITNPRITFEANATRAIMTATALAQHYRPGEGLKPGSPRLLTGCLYEITMIKDTSIAGFRIRHWKLKIVWTEGDLSIVQPPEQTEKRA